MNINYKESQVDFLSLSEGRSDDAIRPRYMAARISLSLENLVILAIAAIMFLIFSFALGIERGKRTTSTVSYPIASGFVPASVKEADPAVVGSVIGVADEAPRGKAQTSSSRVINKVVVPPVEVKKSPVETGASGVTGGAYTLQVASYKNTQPAQREADKLKQKGFRDVYVLPKGAYVIVCVGNFTRKEDASSVKRQLKNRYQDFVIRRL